MTEQTIRTRCESCRAMCLPNEIVSVPNEDRQLCVACAAAEGHKIERAADGTPVIAKATGD
ncbi:MAG: hypothetical protein PHU85_00620 [Phycisphaerae bacterium]|nr:hypothetical protein [Phycisphaerae bacterium]